MTPRRVDHTAIAVDDLDEAIRRFSALLGSAQVERAVVDEQRVEVAYLTYADTRLELISPLDETSGVARFLRSRGESLHHIGMAVDDLDSELIRLAADGVELVDDRPRRGVHGRIAFIHPRGTGGVLIELVEQNHG